MFSYATGSRLAGPGAHADVLNAWGDFATTLGGAWAETDATNPEQRVVTLTPLSGDPVHFVLASGVPVAAGSDQWIHCLPLRGPTGTLPGGGATSIVDNTGTLQVDTLDAWDAATVGIPAGEPGNHMPAVSGPRGIGFPLDDGLATEWWLAGEDDNTVGAFLCMVVKQTVGSQSYWQSVWCGRLNPIAGQGGFAMLATQDVRDRTDLQSAVDSSADQNSDPGCTDPRDLARGTSIFGHPGSFDNASGFTGWVLDHAQTAWRAVNPITYSATANGVNEAATSDTTIGVSQLYAAGADDSEAFIPARRLVGSWEYPIRTSESGMVAPLVSPLFFLPDSGVMRPFAYMPPGVYHCDKRGMPAGTEIAFGPETYVLLPSKRADVALIHRHMDCAIALRKT